VITITGISDHLRLEWPITITGMRRFQRWRPARRLLAAVARPHLPLV
jgi:hypothetical protein